MKSLACSPDLSSATMVLFDSTITVWDLHATACTHTLQKWGQREGAAHASGVNAAVCADDGSRVITMSKDATAKQWDIATGECMLTLTGQELHNTLVSPCHDDLLSAHRMPISTRFKLGLQTAMLTPSFSPTRSRRWHLRRRADA